MPTLKEIRKQYPQYADLSDDALARGLHEKFYADLDFKDFAKRINYLKGANPGEYDPDSKEYKEKYSATSGNSALENFRAGVGRGYNNIWRNVLNITGLRSDEEVAEQNSLDKELMDTGGGKVGSFIGETLAMTPLTGGLSTAANFMKAGSLATRALTNPISRGAIEGAAQGFISAGPDSRANGALVGGIAGAAIPTALKGGSKLVHGLKRTPEAQRLLDEGVSLTPGQMNPGGMINHAEEALQSAPIVGSVIRNAREGAEDQFRRAVVQRGANAPLPAQGTTQELLDAAYQSFDPLYAKAKGFNASTQGLTQSIVQAIDSPAIFADDASRAKVAKFVANQLTAIRGQAQTDDLLKIRSAVRTAARETTEDAEEKLLQAAEGQLTQAIRFALPPQALKTLQHADSQYGIHKIAEKAVAKAKDRPGGFTPTMLSQAIKESTDQGAFARGGGRMRDLSQAGAKTFEVRSPPTGARLGVLGAMGLGSYAEPTVGLPIAGGLLGLAGTQTGRRLAAGQTAAQKALARQIQAITGATPAQARELAAIYSRGLLTAESVNE